MNWQDIKNLFRKKKHVGLGWGRPDEIDTSLVHFADFPSTPSMAKTLLDTENKNCYLVHTYCTYDNNLGLYFVGATRVYKDTGWPKYFVKEGDIAAWVESEEKKLVNCSAYLLSMHEGKWEAYEAAELSPWHIRFEIGKHLLPVLNLENGAELGILLVGKSGRSNICKVKVYKPQPKK